MAGTITTDLAFFTGATTGSSHCDTITDWTGVPTPAPDTVQFIQNTGSLWSYSAATTTSRTWVFTCASTSVTNKVIYFWFSLGSVAWLNLKSAGGLKLRIESSATDYGEWNIAGKDTLPHNGFICHAVHTSQAFDTSGGSINKGAITKVTITALGSFPGKAYLWLDALRYGTYLQIKAGTDVSPAVLEDLNTAEQTVANQYGVLSKFGGIYFIQGQLLIGSTTAGEATYFKDTNQILVFKDSNVPADFYVVTAQGNSTATTTIQMGNVTGTGSSAIGSSGITITAQGTKTWKFSAASAYIDNLKLYACTLNKAAPVEFGNATTAFGGSGKTIHLIDNTFNSPSYIIRNISSASTINQLRNKIAFATDTVASMDLYDGADMADSYFSLIGNSTDGGRGFKNSSSTLTNNILNYNFNNIYTPYITIAAENEVWNAINPAWTVTDQTQLDFLGTAQGTVSEKYNLNITAQEPSGDKLGAVRTFLYEATASPAIPTANQVSTDQVTSTASFTYNNASPATITRSSGSFVTDGFLAGQTLRITGTVNNNKTVTIASVVALTITLITGNTLTQEGPVSSTLTGSKGYIISDVLRRVYTAATPSSALTIVTHADFASKIFKYGKFPFVGAQTIDAAVNSAITLLPDTFQVETTEATAVSDGTGKVVIVESAALSQSHSIIKVTNITTNAFAAGDVLTGGTSGASGTIEEIIEGTGAIGTNATIILKLRNSTAFSGTEAVNRTGGGSSTLVSASEKRFYWLVQAGTISGTKRTLQQLYDHFQAKLGEATIDTADNWNKVVIDGAAEYGSPLQGVSLGSPNSLKTIRNVALTHGWVISGLNSLLGLNAYTANDGTTFTPAVSTTVQLTNVVVGSRCTIFETANPSNVIMLTTATSSTVSTTYVWIGDLGITIRVRKSSTAPKYLPFDASGTITNTGFSLAVSQIADAIA